MAFNLKKVLKALLFSSNHPLAIKDIQAAFTRFHETAAMEQAAAAGDPGEAAEAGNAPASGDSPDAAPTATASAPESSAAAPITEPSSADAAAAATSAAPGEPAEILADAPQDPELYAEVPSLITATQIRETMDQIAAELRAADEGLLLIEGSAGYRLVTHPRFARWVRILRAEPPPVKLSQSSIETLAIVAYRQPVTRGEIETIRGVSAEAGINKLLERELIYIVGRADLPGRPIQYGTTDKFLEFVGVKSLDELPASDVLSSRQIDDWLKTAMNPPALGDTEMGLPSEELPLDGAAPAAGAAAGDSESAAEPGSTPEPAEPAQESEQPKPASP